MDQRLPIPISIKDEEKPLDCLEIIDLDEQISSEDIILEWCTKVRLKFKSFFIADTERNLDTLMKWYIQFLKEEAMNIDDCYVLKVEVSKHLDFFKITFSELDCPFSDNYLDNMEDILALFFELEATTLPKKQNGSHYGNTLKIIGRKLIGTFNTFLFCREERVHHVLMKIKLTSEESTDLLNFLYGKLLTEKSKNKSDLAFCRTYILYQKWKTMQKPESWQEMDRVMYERFNRTPDSLKTNQTLNQILFPQNESVLNVLTHISNNYVMMSEEYFKFMRSQNIQEDSVSSEVINIDLDETTPPEEVDDDDHESFHKVYNDYVESMANITISCESSPASAANGNTQHANSETDDECVIVGVGTIDFDQSHSELVCEILDDDDDIIFFQPKQEIPREREKPNKKSGEAPVSFLDSIDISDPPSRDLYSPIIFTAVTPPSESSDSPTEIVVSKSDHSVPKLPRKVVKVPQSRKKKKHVIDRPQLRKLSRRKIERRKAFLEKRQQELDEQTNRRETEIKSFTHIETQTDFQPAETEEIFRPYKCLVTPPSEHHEDRDIELAENNVYANILPSTSICTQVDMNLEETAMELVEPAAQETIGPEEDPVPPDESVSLLEVTVSDVHNDFSPSSSNLVTISIGQRCSSPTSPDVSSTSHDTIAKTAVATTDECSSREGSESGGPAAGDKWVCRDFDKFQEEMNSAVGKCGRVHSQWDALISNHGLEDNFLSGPLRKVNGTNGCVNPYKNFDLFGNDSVTPLDTSAERGAQQTTPNDSSKTSSSGIPSPPYEGMCDFGNYLSKYKEQNGAVDPFKTPKSVALRRTDDAENCKPKNKKKSLVFAVANDEPVRQHTPQAIPNSAIQGILKKPSVRRGSTRLRISRRQMNLKSLRRYGVEPNDPCLQGDAKIVLERIGDDEIMWWEKMSEISRNSRLQRRHKFNMSTTSLCRVDYDKSTLTLNENDRIQYNTEETTTVPEYMRHWRQSDEGEDDDDDLFASRLEGRLPSKSYDSFGDDDDSATQCEHSSCACLDAEITKLIVSELSFRTANPKSPPTNPFAFSKTPKRRRTDNVSRDPNFHPVAIKTEPIPPESNETLTEPNLCMTNLEKERNCNNSIRLPAIVPEIEDFEKTLRMEEITKNTIPSDLNNLTLRKFSPSPVINCFSPHSNSPSHTFLSDCCPLFTDGDNFDIENNFQESLMSGRNSNTAIVDSLKLPPENIFQENSMESLKYSEDSAGSPVDYKTVPTEDCQGKPSDEKTERGVKTEEPKVRLPLKKRKHPVPNSKGDDSDDEVLGPDLVEEIIKRARAERIDREDISYPAKPAISIAEIQEKLEPQPRTFKTPAERKEMPPAPTQTFLEQPKIVTEQYNNHTYNNPTINYHMNNVPYPFFSCGSLSYFPPILLPVNSTATFDVNVMNQQQQVPQQPPQEIIGRPKKERKSRRKKKE